MATSSAAAAAFGEHLFSLQVRVLILADGWGTKRDRTHAWLGADISLRSYPAEADRVRGRDAALFYFLDASAARAFVCRFMRGAVALEPDPAPEPPP